MYSFDGAIVTKFCSPPPLSKKKIKIKPILIDYEFAKFVNFWLFFFLCWEKWCLPCKILKYDVRGIVPAMSLELLFLKFTASSKSLNFSASLQA